MCANGRTNVRTCGRAASVKRKAARLGNTKRNDRGHGGACGTACFGARNVMRPIDSSVCVGICRRANSAKWSPGQPTVHQSLTRLRRRLDRLRRRTRHRCPARVDRARRHAMAQCSAMSMFSTPRVRAEQAAGDGLWRALARRYRTGRGTCMPAVIRVTGHKDACSILRLAREGKCTEFIRNNPRGAVDETHSLLDDERNDGAY